MPAEMKGRRIPIERSFRDPVLVCREAGDYCGPIDVGNGRSAVYFLLPTARDHDAHSGARSLHHVQSPPHVFREEADGSLTIRESIGAGPGGNYYWHGYLNYGSWELSKRD